MVILVVRRSVPHPIKVLVHLGHLDMYDWYTLLCLCLYFSLLFPPNPLSSLVLAQNLLCKRITRTLVQWYANYGNDVKYWNKFSGHVITHGHFTFITIIIQEAQLCTVYEVYI